MYLNLSFSAFIDHNNCNYSINHTYVHVVIFSVMKKPTLSCEWQSGGQKGGTASVVYSPIPAISI